MDSSESTEMDSKGSESTQAAILVAVRVRPFSAEEQAQLAKPEGQQFGPTARNLASYTEPAAEPTKGGTIRRVVHAIDDHVVVFDP
ncbi:tubulin-dependent ATPase kip3, partial [Coemansia sp. Cherry 401B]